MDDKMSSAQINLLVKIDELGSIAKAAKAIGISYKTAWDTINVINKQVEQPLVKGGGSTVLTTAGKKVVNQFKTIRMEQCSPANNQKICC